MSQQSACRKNILKKIIASSKGQIAIFVALIFQVLFVFFAMVINVGLLVHHKINLQNSVDLAAYYGAAKQAEMMNAMGHVNYQIRQAYKLWMFRYTQLGSAGDQVVHPYRFAGGAIERSVLAEDDDKVNEQNPAFCIGYAPISIVNTGTKKETYCKDSRGVNIPKPGVPTFGSGVPFFKDIQLAFEKAARSYREAARRTCLQANANTWELFIAFYNAYKRDINLRKKSFISLANAISNSADSQNFSDIDGKSIREGVYKTLFKNLTPPNQDSMRAAYGEKGDRGGSSKDAIFQMYNSLADSRCGNPGDPDSPPQWLSEIFYYPNYTYFLGKCGADSEDLDDIELTARRYTDFDPNLVPSELSKVDPQKYRDYSLLVFEPNQSSPSQQLLRSSFGFEKNPWCMAYVAVQAQTTPNIPFSPLGSVKLQAKAYAKPFGGRIGPWYGKTWKPDQPQSDSGNNNKDQKTDPRLPIRVSGQPDAFISAIPSASGIEADVIPNHSRYPGDKAGIRSQLTMAYYGKEIHRFLENNGSLDTVWWSDISEGGMDNSVNEDFLAFQSGNARADSLRSLELASVVPDLFDTAYYSIDANFMRNYGERINAGYVNKIKVRPDLGARKSVPNLVNFGIRQQMAYVDNPARNTLNFNTKIKYSTLNFGSLLTSWQQSEPDDFNISPTNFAKCTTPVGATGVDLAFTDEKQRTSGDCIIGGRTGYSVKIVNKQFLEAGDLELGGKGITGAIKNPPPF